MKTIFTAIMVMLCSIVMAQSKIMVGSVTNKVQIGPLTGNKNLAMSRHQSHSQYEWRRVVKDGDRQRGYGVVQSGSAQNQPVANDCYWRWFLKPLNLH